MNKLSNEEVLHVAELGRLELTKEEIEKFSYQLKALFTEIDKINDIELNNDDILISPTENKCEMIRDEALKCNYAKDLLNNAPKKYDNFVEIRGVFNE